MKKNAKNRYLPSQNRNGEIDTRHLNRRQSVSAAGLAKLESNRTVVDIDKEMVLARLIL